MDLDEQIPDDVLALIGGRGDLDAAAGQRAVGTAGGGSVGQHADVPHPDVHPATEGGPENAQATDAGGNHASDPVHKILMGDANGASENGQRPAQAQYVPEIEEPPRKRARKTKGKAAEVAARTSGRKTKAPSPSMSDATRARGLSQGATTTGRDSTSEKGRTTAPPPHPIASGSNLSNSEQLVALRDYYAKNPTPTKLELVELARATGRPWLKVKEYFRQRRNKLRGVEELDNLQEPARAVSWLHMSYRSANNPQKCVSQLELYQNYKLRFDAFHKSAPLLGGSDLIQLTCATFPFCTMAKEDSGPDGSTEWLLKGIRKKKEDEEDGRKEDTELEGAVRAAQDSYAIDDRTAETMQDFVSGMPEPLRAGTWLLEDFQDLPETAGDSVDPTVERPVIMQTEFYAAYAGRFGEALRYEGPPAPASNELQTIEQAVATAQIDDGMRGSVTREKAAPVSETGAELESGSVAEEGAASDFINGVGNVMDSVAGAPNQPSYEYKPPVSSRLLSPLELIQLAQMTFKNAHPMIDEGGRYIISGMEKRNGVSKFKGKDILPNAMFPFGLLDVPSSSPTRPFADMIKQKLTAIDGASAARNPSDPDSELPDGSDQQHHGLSLAEHFDHNHLPVPPEDQAIFEMMLAEADGNVMDTGYAEPLPDHDRELLDGLRRFKSSRLGKEVRDTCVSQ